jgi:hypothetical protein
MKDTRNGAQPQQPLKSTAGSDGIDRETFSVAWPGQAPAYCGPWREACTILQPTMAFFITNFSARALWAAGGTARRLSPT